MRYASFILILWVVITGLSASARKAENTQAPSEVHLKAGIHAEKSGDYNTAIDELLQSIYFARNNYQPMAYYYLGQCYKATHQDAKAIEAYNKHLEQNLGPSPDARVDLGELYMRNGRDQEAEMEFNKSLVEYRGPAPRSHNALGLLLEKRDKLDSAEWQFLQALGDRPWSYTPAWMNLAENAMRQGNWSEAIKQLTDLLDHNPHGLDKAKAHIDLGVCLLAKGDHQGALENWRQACEINPTLADPHLLLARLFDREKHITSAIHEYQAYIRLGAADNPALKEAKDRVIYLEQQIKTTEPESMTPLTNEQSKTTPTNPPEVPFEPGF